MRIDLKPTTYRPDDTDVVDYRTVKYTVNYILMGQVVQSMVKLTTG